MSEIKIHVLHCGSVCVSPHLPYGGDNCSLFKAAGITTPKKDWVWLPVSAYLIEHPKGKILVDTGWHRDMSPEGVFDKKAQMCHLGFMLYHVNQGVVKKGEDIKEQLAALGINPGELDFVLVTHLDCDHASGLKMVSEAKKILVAESELKFALRHPVRYTASMWSGVNFETFEFSETGMSPVGKSLDLFGDGSVQLVNIPGHADGLFAVVIKNSDGKFVLLYSDGGYATKSWQEQIRPGISADPELQMKSLRWIRDMSENPDCVESLANHDDGVVPHVIAI